jgi:paraquat-inducible protein A
VLVALVRLGEIATVLPGPGLVAFTAVVVLTILATSSFDPILIWQDPERRT